MPSQAAETAAVQCLVRYRAFHPTALQTAAFLEQGGVEGEEVVLCVSGWAPVPLCAGAQVPQTFACRELLLKCVLRKHEGFSPTQALNAEVSGQCLEGDELLSSFSEQH